MFKRLEKKRARELADEESGMKEIKELLSMAGGEDEVSGESDTDSDSDDDDSEAGYNGSDSGDEAGEILKAEGAGEMMADDDHDEEEQMEEDEEDTVPMIPISAILKNDTTFPHPTLPPPSRSCLLCPDKILKNSKMEEVHIISSDHNRALKRFRTYIAANPYTGSEDGEDVRDSLEILFTIAEQTLNAKKAQQERSNQKSQIAAELRQKKRDKIEASKKARLEKKGIAAEDIGVKVKAEATDSQSSAAKEVEAEEADAPEASTSVSAEPPKKKMRSSHLSKESKPSSDKLTATSTEHSHRPAGKDKKKPSPSKKKRFDKRKATQQLGEDADPVRGPGYKQPGGGRKGGVRATVDSGYAGRTSSQQEDEQKKKGEGGKKRKAKDV